MVGDIIARHFAEGARRLTLPGVGTFIARPGGGVAFTEIMSADDGVLAGILARGRDVPAHKAAAEVAKYVARVRKSLDGGGEVVISGFGTLARNAAGEYTFTTVAAGHDFTSVAKVEEPVAPVAEAGEPFTPVAAEPVPGVEPPTPAAVEAVPVDMPSHAAEPVPGAEPVVGMEPLAEYAGTSRIERTVEAPLDIPMQSAAPTEESEAMPDERVEAIEPAGADYRPRIHIQQRRRRKADGLIIVAILVIIVALCVLLYGYMTSRELAG